MLRLFLLIILSVFSFTVASQSRMNNLESNEDSLLYYQFKAQTVFKPSPVVINHKTYLNYEIFMTNVGSYPFTLNKVEVLDADHHNKVLFTYDTQQLLKMIKSYAAKNPNEKPDLTLQPGMFNELFFMPEFVNESHIPKNLLHRFYFSIVKQEGSKAQIPETFSIITTPIKVDFNPAVVIGKPLSGNYWMAFNGPATDSVHRRASLASDGNLYHPERFAIDFMQFGEDGNMYRNNDPTKNENYYSYGANIYSVAAGKVVAIKDGIADNKPQGRDYPIELSNMGGNYIIVDIGHHQYAFYAHLIPGSIKVKIGDHVKKGQVIGELGNSGNSDAPHLHFHIIDAPSPLEGEGVTYVFDNFSTEEYTIPHGDEPPIVYSGHVDTHKNELVHERQLVTFK